MQQPATEMIRAALAHHQSGRLREAEAAFRAVLGQPLDDRIAADCQQHLAFVLEDAGRGSEAVEAYRAAARLHPSDAIVPSNLASALIRVGAFDEAEHVARDASERFPQSADLHNQLGAALTEKGDPAGALRQFQLALELRNDDAEIHYNRGVALIDLRRFDEAIAALESAIALRSDFAEAHAKLGIALLTVGDFQRGWREYEWRERWTRPGAPPAMWDGSDLHGKTIVLEAEQGLGDAIQFSRYAEAVAHRGGKVIVAAPAALHRLLARARGVSEVVDMEGGPAGAVRFPLLGLGRLFGTTLENIPAAIPYIDPDPTLVAQWRDRIGDDGVVRVGIAWAGNAAQRDDRWRSCRLGDLAPLADIANVKLHSLQVGKPAHEPPPFELMNISPQLTDLAETAAAMMNLDLVITVDTAVAHLAGALGRPVWVLLFATSDWRWLVEREDSPWYPTMRLFRQRERGRWDETVSRVAAELRRMK